MKKTLSMLALLIMSTSLFAANDMGYRVKKRGSCTASQFWASVYSNGYVLVKDASGTRGTYEAIIDFPINGELASTLSTKFSTEFGKPAGMSDAIWTEMRDKNILFKQDVETKTPCLLSHGFTIGYRFQTQYPSGNADTNLSYSSFQSKNPQSGDPGRIFLIDSLMAGNTMFTAANSNIDSGMSYMPDYPTAVVPQWNVNNHGNYTAFIAYNMGNTGVSLYPMAIGYDVTASDKAAAKAIDDAASIAVGTPNKKSVINMSFASPYGNSAETREAIKNAVSNGVPVVQAMENNGKYAASSAVYDPNLITVGTVKGTELVSSYGAMGPDLVVDISGTAPILDLAGQMITDDYSKYGASGAAAQVSAAIGRMQNVCPLATPKDIKKVLLDSATYIAITNKPGDSMSAALTSAKRVNLNAAVNLALLKLCPTYIATSEKPSAWIQEEWYTWQWNIQFSTLSERYRKISYQDGCKERGKAVTLYSAYTEQCGNSSSPGMMHGFTSVFRNTKYWSTYSDGHMVSVK